MGCGAHQRKATTDGRRTGRSEEGRRSTLMCLRSLAAGGLWVEGAARRTNVLRIVVAQERGAFALHICDGRTAKKVTKLRPSGGALTAPSWGRGGPR
jgi:hypothetical protein